MGRRLNRKRSKRNRDFYRSAMKIVFPAEVIADIDKLSEETGIGIRQIVEDGMIDSIPTLRTEVYGDLIRFRKRRGQIVHERDLQTIDGRGEEPAPAEETRGSREVDTPPVDTGAGENGSNDVSELPGRPPATPENLGLDVEGYLEASPSDDDLPL